MSQTEPRILIVDDEEDTCNNLSDIFSEYGYQVDTAQEGVSALKLIESNLPYDVVLLDLRMPGMNGLELYHRIKQRSAGTEALIVTAYASSDTARSALAAGARKVVSKPVNIGKLIGLVQEALDCPLVLVVDDDHELCDNLWDIFHERGFRVHLVHDVAEAEATLSQRQFHVVLLDMKLPSGNGAAILKSVRATNPQARTIVVTGHPDEMESRVQHALAEGAAGVVYKPFDVAGLLQTVSELAPPARGGRP